MQASGFYHSLSTRATQSYRQYNTWMGDPVRALQAREMIKIIRRNGLVENTKDTGDYLFNKLDILQSGIGTGKMHNLRGKGYVPCSSNETGCSVPTFKCHYRFSEGTFIAFDCDSAQMRDAFIKEMRSKGINLGGCGDRGMSSPGKSFLRNMLNRCEHSRKIETYAVRSGPPFT